MRSISEINSNRKLEILTTSFDGGNGFVMLQTAKGYKKAVVVYSWCGGWEHVSVSFKNRVPTWDEMCQVKEVFWGDDEVVMQLHPKKSEYINTHPYCLHLWKPIDKEIPTPPKMFV